MRRAFIVRPFDKKEVAPGREVDFDRIDRELISPALNELGIHGRTTVEILRQGEIQGDMFHRLVTADLVIADISMHNANVFYELGIRHALQDRHTVLIKFRIPGQKTVFDIATDRYMLYDEENPGASVDDLVKRIDATLNENQPDSPVFRFLPELEPQKRERFVKVPREFAEQVELAQRAGYDGDLETYAAELAELDIPWASAGLRLVAEALFRRKAWDAAREAWQAILETNSLDPHANRRLATIFQKHDKPDLDRSDQAVQRAIEGADPALRAELLSLRGSNAKTRWLEAWQGEEDLTRRRQAALCSPYLEQAISEYHTGFLGYLNHYYAGINALLLMKIRIELAKAARDTWNGGFESDEAAGRELDKTMQTYESVRAALAVSISAAKDKGDPWAAITEADYQCLVSDRAAYVKRQYERALTDVDDQARDSARRQLELLQSLHVCADNAARGLDVIYTFGPAKIEDPPSVVLVFAGHRIDAPGRTPERFPVRSEALARQMIHAKLEELQQQTTGSIVGYAGCASGGDILFHEVCDELGIPTSVLLVGPRADYVRESVQDSGQEWIVRFDAILRGRGERVRELTDDMRLPQWLRAVDGFSIWEHNNLWTLHTALAHGGDRAVLIALWNGQAGDGPGGTEHMVEEVKKRGGRAIVLPAQRLVEA